MLLNQPDFSIQPTGARPQANSYLICFSGSRVLVRRDGDHIDLPVYEELLPFLPEGFIPFELAHVDSRTIFTAHPYKGSVLPETEQFRYEDVHIFRSLPFSKAVLITTCWHLWSWYQSHRFCGCCGHANQPDEKERALRCTACGRLSFPVICPAVIVAVTCGEKILLAKSLNSPYRHYGLVAGYVEVGETLEQLLQHDAVGSKLGNGYAFICNGIHQNQVIIFLTNRCVQ